MAVVSCWCENRTQDAAHGCIYKVYSLLLLLLPPASIPSRTFCSTAAFVFHKRKPPLHHASRHASSFFERHITWNRSVQHPSSSRSPTPHQQHCCRRCCCWLQPLKTTNRQHQKQHAERRDHLAGHKPPPLQLQGQDKDAELLPQRVQRDRALQPQQLPARQQQVRGGACGGSSSIPSRAGCTCYKTASRRRESVTDGRSSTRCVSRLLVLLLLQRLRLQFACC